MPETYTRGQVTLALWKFFARSGNDDVPTQFDTRIRAFNALGVPGAVRIKPGTGKAVLYTAHDAFELCVALSLQDHAIKSGDAAHISQKMRPELQAAFDRINSDPEAYAPHALLCFRLAEIVDGWGQDARGPKCLPPVITSANVLVGTEAAMAELFSMATAGEGRFILPIGHFATQLQRYLAEAPERRSGRPPRKAA